MTNRVTLFSLMCVIMLGLTNFGPPVAARGKREAELNAKGEELRTNYNQRLQGLKKEVKTALPTIDENKKTAFLNARAALAKIKTPPEGSGAATINKYKESKKKAEADVLEAARKVLADLDAFLSRDKLDDKLVEIAILTHGTSRGLAEFAQQGEVEKALLDKLFADKALMKQILLAGGANGGEYGEAMQVYTAIQKKSERARERGNILQRLALGTALQQPWLKGEDKGGVYGIVYTDNTTPDGPVARYMHYEKAYLNGELDPVFEDMNTWECRFITNDPYTNESLGWTRKMLRNYRPDHITNPNYKWRYARMVKSDVPYRSPDWRPNEGTTKVQQIVAGGGKCGPRAFFGRTVCRAFGIPSRRSTQTGHGAMNHWTPDGWVVCFGAWWSYNWCGPWGGLDFFLESQAREHAGEFMKVLRAQWVGDALGEEDVSIRRYGKGGGLWNGLAFYKKRIVVHDAEQEALDKELAELSREEGQKLGESDEVLGDKEEKPQIEIPEKDKTITVAKDGVITVPVAACVRPEPGNNTDRILFMKNLEDEVQVHYAGLGKRPELLKYNIEAPEAGKYNLSMRVVTVARNQKCLLRLNRRTLIDVDLPTSWGMWEDTEPVPVNLKKGRNTLMFTCKPPNRGVTLKHLKLTPVER